MDHPLGPLPLEEEMPGPSPNAHAQEPFTQPSSSPLLSIAIL